MKYINSVDGNLSLGRDRENDTALTLACCFGSKHAVDYLINELKADVHDTGRYQQNSFLRAACGANVTCARNISGGIKTLKFLYALDPKLIETKDKFNRNALDIATHAGNSDVVHGVLCMHALVQEPPRAPFH